MQKRKLEAAQRGAGKRDGTGDFNPPRQKAPRTGEGESEPVETMAGTTPDEGQEGPNSYPLTHKGELNVAT